MSRSIHMAVIMSALTISPIAVREAGAQEHYFTHKQSLGGQIKTNHSFVQILEGDYVELTSSALTVKLNPGETAVFVYEFDAECRLYGGGFSDHVSVQARVNGAVGLFGSSFMQPQDVPTNLGFCGTNAWHSVSEELGNQAAQHHVLPAVLHLLDLVASCRLPCRHPPNDWLPR